MNFIKYPTNSFASALSHADRTIYLHLLLRHFNYCRNNYDLSFYLTDRDLAEVSGCSLDTVWKSKKHLRDSRLISFEIGPKNKTYYKIISGNGKDPG